jgi:hypothetical protein
LQKRNPTDKSCKDNILIFNDQILTWKSGEYLSGKFPNNLKLTAFFSTNLKIKGLELKALIVCDENVVLAGKSMDI